MPFLSVCQNIITPEHIFKYRHAVRFNNIYQNISIFEQKTELAVEQKPHSKLLSSASAASTSDVVAARYQDGCLAVVSVTQSLKSFHLTSDVTAHRLPYLSLPLSFSILLYLSADVCFEARTRFQT